MSFFSREKIENEDIWLMNFLVVSQLPISQLSFSDDFVSFARSVHNLRNSWFFFHGAVSQGVCFRKRREQKGKEKEEKEKKEEEEKEKEKSVGLLSIAKQQKANTKKRSERAH